MLSDFDLTLTGHAAEVVRGVNAVAGTAAFALMCFRLTGRWVHMSWLSRCVVTLLALAVLCLGLGSARAAAIGAPFNELLWLALLVNLGTVTVGLAWHRWLDPTGRRL